MTELKAHHAAAGHHYSLSGLDGMGYDYEVVRLDLHSPVERAITERYLQRYIPDGATVADIGAGSGHYSEMLALRGCRVHLIDVARRLLDTAVERLTLRGLGDQIIDTHHASATDLAFLADASCDAVLLLGPLYSLGDRAERRQAIAEAARVVRPGGLVFAAGINRLAFFRDEFRKKPAGAAARTTLFERVLREGAFPPPPDGSPSTFHMTTVEEFGTELSAAFTPVVLAGVESFASSFQESLLQVSDADAQAWLDVVEQTGRTPEGLGQTDHYLYIGRR